MSIKEVLSKSFAAIFSGAKVLVDNNDTLIGENSKRILSDQEDSRKLLDAIDNLAADDEKQIEEVDLRNGKITVEML